MRRFLIWFIIFFIAYCAFFIYTHNYFSNNPRRIVIAIATSIKMKNKAVFLTKKINSELHRRYTVHTIITDKSRLFSWTDKPAITKNLKFYGPSNPEKLIDINQYPELLEADQIICFLVKGTDLRIIKQALPKAKIITL